MNQKCMAVVAAFLVVAGATTFTSPAQGGVAGKAVREAAEYFIKKFGPKAAKEGVEALVRRLDDLVAKYGDDVLKAAKKVGPRGLDAIEEAGPLGRTAAKYLAKYGDEALAMAGKPQALRLASEFGDEAARALIKHPGIAERLIAKQGERAARALVKLNRQQARRLAMMERSGELGRIGRTAELLDVIGRYGNRAMDFIWRHKKSLAVAAVLATFLKDPEPYINGVKDLAGQAIEGGTKVATEVIRSIGEIGKEGVREAARGTNWTLVALAALGIGTTVFVVRSWLRNRRAPALKN